MNDKAKKSRDNLNRRDLAFYNKCERLIGELCKACEIHRGDESTSRELADPCADEYRDKLAANTAFYSAVDALQVLRQTSEDADMAYQMCVDEHGPTTGTEDDPNTEPPVIEP